MKRLVTVIFLSTIIPTLAAADCYYDGQLVPEGTRIGPMVCENNQWVYKP